MSSIIYYLIRASNFGHKPLSIVDDHMQICSILYPTLISTISKSIQMLSLPASSPLPLTWNQDFNLRFMEQVTNITYFIKLTFKKD